MMWRPIYAASKGSRRRMNPSPLESTCTTISSTSVSVTKMLRLSQSQDNVDGGMDHHRQRRCFGEDDIMSSDVEYDFEDEDGELTTMKSL
ncbi:unnamed protein product [Linum trigynum]|uniref:Uncharacterized protein n=1 Tax=Linum trigynum TaxID=586398 RepID=A0AAV2DU67_9ROSI